MLKRGGSFASRCCLGGQTVNAYVSGELAESKCLRQVALLDLSILNFSIVLGKSGGPSRNRPAKHHSRSHDVVIRVYDESADEECRCFFFNNT